MTYELDEPVEKLLLRQPPGTYITFGTTEDDPDGLLLMKTGTQRWQTCTKNPIGWKESSIIYLMTYDESPWWLS